MSRHRSYKIEKDMTYDNKEIVEYIDRYIHSERDRAMLKRKLLNTDITFPMLAEEFGYSVRHTKRVYYKAVHTLFKEIEEHQL